jgi:hypothetical protein
LVWFKGSEGIERLTSVALQGVVEVGNVSSIFQFFSYSSSVTLEDFGVEMGKKRK